MNKYIVAMSVMVGCGGPGAGLRPQPDMVRFGVDAVLPDGATYAFEDGRSGLDEDGEYWIGSDFALGVTHSATSGCAASTALYRTLWTELVFDGDEAVYDGDLPFTVSAPTEGRLGVMFEGMRASLAAIADDVVEVTITGDRVIHWNADAPDTDVVSPMPMIVTITGLPFVHDTVPGVPSRFLAADGVTPLCEAAPRAPGNHPDDQG